MKKILVPTDFSANSKAGLRFAIHWATLQKLELIFIHTFHITRPDGVNDSDYLQFIKAEKNFLVKKLEKFVRQVYQSMGVKPGRHALVVQEGLSPDLTIMQYCRQKGDIDFICISTRGAGRFKRILGTNTGNLITKSKVPVIAIPKNYRVRPFRQFMFAADFRNYRKELEKVVTFARPLKIPVEVVHFTWPDEALPDKEIIESGIEKEFRFPVKLHFEKTDARYSLVQNLQKQIEATKPSMAIMFTDQERTLYQKTFLSSKTEQLSFQLKVPLLVFHKN